VLPAGQTVSLLVSASLISLPVGVLEVQVGDASGLCKIGFQPDQISTSSMALQIDTSIADRFQRVSSPFYVRCDFAGHFSISAKDVSGRYAPTVWAGSSSATLRLWQAMQKFPFRTVFHLDSPKFIQRGVTIELRPTLLPIALATLKVAISNGPGCALSQAATTAAASTATTTSIRVSAQPGNSTGRVYLQCSVGTLSTQVTVLATEEGSSGMADEVTIRILPASGCGNGTRDNNEACDDANTIDGDGCSEACDVEAGWACMDSPSLPGVSLFLGFGEGGTTSRCYRYHTVAPSPTVNGGEGE